MVINLVLSVFEGHRDVGLALLSQLPPYEVARVVDFIKGFEQTERTVKGTRTKVVKAKGSRVSTKKEVKDYEVKKVRVGLNKNVPRSLKTEVERYLREREKSDKFFDTAVASGRKAIKRLYASLHIKPSDRAQAILFDEVPPEDSQAFYVKQIAKAATPEEQARAIVKHRIPYRVASSIIRDLTPMVVAALVDVMSPQELINSLGSLQQKGAMDNPDIKGLIEKKLEEAKKSKRVAAFKTGVAADAAGVSDDVREKLDEVRDAQVKKKARITRSTALLIDRSGSMGTTIEVGKQLGAMIAAVMDAELHTMAFDTACYVIDTPKTGDIAAWEKAFHGISAGGGTSCGIALDRMRKSGTKVEQLVFITDEDENQAPRFEDVYPQYVATTGVRPDVTIVRVGASGPGVLSRSCAKLGLAVNSLPFSGDYSSLPNLLPMLTSSSTADLVSEILSFPLPQRKQPQLVAL